MQRYFIQTMLTLAIVIAPQLLTGRDGSAQGIPDEQPPLRRLIKPAQADIAPPGTEKCVIFTREKIGDENDWNFVAGAWEFIPSKPKAGVVKRVEFARSSWSAHLALDDDQSIDGPAQEFVLLQVDDSRRKPAYRPHLYRIDFRTWDVEFLGSKFSGVRGGNRDTLLVYSSSGIVPLDVKTATIVPNSEPFVMLGRDYETDLWLITSEKSGKADVWSYRPATLEKIAQVPWPQRLWQRGMHETRSAARPDGKAWALVTLDKTPDRTTSVRKSAFGEKVQEEGSLWLAEAGAKEARRWPVQFQAAEGSGVGWRGMGIDLWFDGKNLCFQATSKDTNGTDVIRQWTVSEDGARIDESVAAKRHEPSPVPQLSLIRIPEKFRPKSGNEFTSEKYLLAAYFLKWKGCIKQMPQYADCRVGFTKDKKRFLWKTQPRTFSGDVEDRKDNLPSPNVLLYGDLEKGIIMEVPCPPELVEDNALEIEWVVTQ